MRRGARRLIQQRMMFDTTGNGDPVSTAERQGLLDADRDPRSRAPGDWRGRLHRLAVLLIAADVVLAALLGGLRLRQWMWIHTDTPQASMRFDFDIENAHKWGTEILRHAAAKAAGDPRGGHATDWRHFWPAYVELYDRVVKEHPEGEYQLDYTPTRLFIAALWVRHERLVYPHVMTWMRPYDYTAPLLRLNSACELIAAIGAFLLVRHWVWRGTLPPRPLFRRRRAIAVLSRPTSVPTRAWVLGLAAAVLIWLNPAVLFDAHVFPQWDVWLLPSFFLAAWLASVDWWFTAGLLIPFGVLMKGQLTMVTPFFILWPLLEGKPMAAVRFVLGCAAAAVALLSPWLVPGSRLWGLIGCATFLGILIPADVRALRQLSSGKELAVRLVAATSLALLWPLMWVSEHWHWLGAHRRVPPLELANVTAAFLLIFALVMAWRPVRWRQISWREIRWPASSPLFASAGFVVAVLLCAIFFHGSTAWHKVSFEYPTHHWRQLAIGEADNLGMILSNPPFLWRLDEPMFTLHRPFSHAGWNVTIKALLIATYGVCLVLCSVGAAVKSRRNDPAFLVALCAPWVILFAVLPQMHERYLLWAAAVSAICIAVSIGWGLMHVFLTIVSTSMIVRLLLEFGANRPQAPGWTKVLGSMHPGVAWAVLLCAGIYLYFAVAPHRPRRSMPK